MINPSQQLTYAPTVAPLLKWLSTALITPECPPLPEAVTVGAGVDATDTDFETEKLAPLFAAKHKKGRPQTVKKMPKLYIEETC
jgi:hypothetical protein